MKKSGCIFLLLLAFNSLQAQNIFELEYHFGVPGDLLRSPTKEMNNRFVYEPHARPNHGLKLSYFHQVSDFFKGSISIGTGIQANRFSYYQNLFSLGASSRLLNAPVFNYGLIGVPVVLSFELPVKENLVIDFQPNISYDVPTESETGLTMKGDLSGNNYYTYTSESKLKSGVNYGFKISTGWKTSGKSEIRFNLSYQHWQPYVYTFGLVETEYYTDQKGQVTSISYGYKGDKNAEAQFNYLSFGITLIRKLNVN